MKTTYLFKFPGAWSPLWIGHEAEKSFEVKPYDFGPIFIPFPQPTNAVFTFNEMAEMIEQSIGISPACQAEMQGKSASHIAFSEYHDPYQFGLPTGTGVLPMETVVRMSERSVELFGIGVSQRQEFFDCCMTGKLVIVRNHGNGKTIAVRA